MKILLKIAYLGTNYAGFQAQRGSSCRTVQETLTEAVCLSLGKPCHVTGCSRTDSGVHARGFCASIEAVDGSDITVPVEKIPVSVNHRLPEDVAVLDAALVPDSLHPRYNVKSKEYVYVFSDSPTRDPFLFDRAMYLKAPLTVENVTAMHTAAQSFVGTHDFSAFMAQGSKITDTVRTVYSASVRRVADTVEFRVSADGFLYNMVRIMAGTLLAVGQGKLVPERVAEIVLGKDRRLAGITAPPHGLYLDRVEYGTPIAWALADRRSLSAKIQRSEGSGGF
ncbi:MAG: tRNA pseudouridine(38-40) synthase TruA [Clostridia bacterium]|nr:tRNA pseudouridine(38-40) synthase TruA [Clostridia bacterium]